MKRSLITSVFLLMLTTSAFCFASPFVANANENSLAQETSGSIVYALGDEPTEIEAPAATNTQTENESSNEQINLATLNDGNTDVSLQPGDNVWVNGKSGDDSNPGTENYPVKTFARAKELMDELGSDIIWVTGALQVSGTTETWDLNGKTIMRDGGYHGELVRVSNKATLTLSNIVIDGGLSNGAFGRGDILEGNGGSLVGVYTESELTVKEGAKLQNNRVIDEGHWYPETGGGIFASNSTVNVSGGTISGNSAVYGGGISAMYESVVNVYSGEISNNKAVKGTSQGTPKDYSGCGGGICVYSSADLNVYGGTITGNTAFERGGGISVGCYYSFFNSDSSVFTMTGGTISNNKAGSSGGGIFVQAGLTAKANNGTPNYSIAHISAGEIINNSVVGGGYGSTSFGGGGIYVNGYSHAVTTYQNGELYLENAVISGNSAVIDGGGYAGCPVSCTEVFLSNGSVFYGNKTESGTAREIYVKASLAYGTHSGDPAYEVSPSMLGGGAYRWVYDDGTEVPLNELKGTLSASAEEELRLSNDLDATDTGVQKALELATVHITGNTSVARGGGIGSNGSVFIGKSVDTTEIHVSKVWDDQDNKDGARPSSVEVELYRDGEYVGYQTVTPDADGNWATTFENLPKADAEGNEYVYTIKERNVEGYAAEVTGTADEGFIIANRRTTSVDVIKTWDDGNNVDGKRPSSVTVDLLRDGTKVDSARIEADEEGSWSHSFTGLLKYDPSDGHEYSYTVKEHSVEGYESKVEGSAAKGFVVTNSYTPEVTSIEVNKKWAGPVAESASVKLQSSEDGKEWADVQDASATLTKDVNWSYKFENLPVYASGKQGVKLTYRVVEDALENYETTYLVSGKDSDGTVTPVAGKTEQVTIINTNTEKVAISGTKVWDDASNQDGVRPGSITVRLLADGKEVASKELTAADATEDNSDVWSFSFGDLAKYDTTDGHEIAYTVKEDAVEGYTSKIEGSVVDGFVVTNTKSENPPTPDKPEQPDQPEEPDKPNQPSQPDQPEKTSKELPTTGDSSSVVFVVTAFGLIAVMAACVSAGAQRKYAQNTKRNG